MKSSITIPNYPVTARTQPYPVQTRLSTHTQWKLFQATLLAGDALMILFSFWLAYQVRFRASIPFFRLDVEPMPAFYNRLAWIAALSWLLVFVFLGLYQRDNLLGGVNEYSLVFRGLTKGILLIVLAGFLEPDFIFARGWLITAGIAALILLGVWRFVMRRVVYWQRKHGYFLSPALIVGANQEGKMLAEQMWNWRTSGLHIVGMLDDTLPVNTPVYKHIKVLGRLDEVEQIVEQCQASELIIASSALPRECKLLIFERFGFSKDVNLRLSSGLFEIVTTGLKVKEVAYVPLVQVNQLRMEGTDQLLKLLLDYGLVLPGLILISPLLLLIAIAIKLDSPGPLIHRRRVMGVNSSQFDAFKFRTMHANGDQILEKHPEKKEELERTYKIVDDPRITRIGNFLRKFSLDEFPQLINVLRGEMSLVGPRMISPPEMEMYQQWGMNLLTVRPGITGMWQVSGRSDVSYEERVRMDMNYIRNWTIWLDLQLLIRTIPAVLRGRGAY
jgi:exopolysaccharide biosynthesis polyprenyl glycosylphosphotransferase